MRRDRSPHQVNDPPMTKPSPSPLSPGVQARAVAELNERSREILRQIVESYLTTGEPVGSRNISRILPTELGLRFFVDALLEVGDVAADERARIEAQMRAAASRRTFDTALAEASALLSGL